MSLATGRDSPVRRASSVSKLLAETRRRSAGTTSPVGTFGEGSAFSSRHLKKNPQKEEELLLTSLEFDDISDDDFGGGNSDGFAVANDLGGGGSERAKRVHRLCAAVLLQKADSDVDDDDGADDSSFDPRLNTCLQSRSRRSAQGGVNWVAKGQVLTERDGEANDKHEHHGVEDLSGEDGPRVDSSSSAELVAPIASLETGDSRVGETLLGVRLEKAGRLVDGEEEEGLVGGCGVTHVVCVVCVRCVSR
jgi:hypothetical protein